MGQDLDITMVWTTKPDALNWEAGTVAIDALSAERISEMAEDLDEEDDDVRPIIAAALKSLREWWTDGGSRETEVRDLGPVRVLVTGGMSGGDPPTDATETLSLIPDEVLQAVGFFA